jgi:hypothetical protein
LRKLVPIGGEIPRVRPADLAIDRCFARKPMIRQHESSRRLAIGLLSVPTEDTQCAPKPARGTRALILNAPRIVGHAGPLTENGLYGANAHK